MKQKIPIFNIITIFPKAWRNTLPPFTYSFHLVPDCTPYDCIADAPCGISVPDWVCDGIDFNNDGLFPDTLDIDDFLSVYSGGACSSGDCNDIDFNNDGLFPDTLDIDALLSVFSGGPCLL